MARLGTDVWTLVAAATLACSAVTPCSAAPKLEFHDTTHDFGAIWDVATLPCNFSFTNTGDEPLIIEKVAPSCGCTTTTLDTTTYAPGASGTIEAAFKPNATGALKKSVTVLSNDPVNPTTKLTLTADVTAFVVPSQRFVRLSNVRQGVGGEAVVRFTPARPGFVFDPNVRIHGSSARHVSATIIPPAEGDTSEARSFKIALAPDTPWGDVQAFVTVRGQGATDMSLPQRPHEIKVPVLGSVHGRLRADSTFFSLGGIEPGGSFEKRIRLKHTEGAPFNILDTQVSMRLKDVSVMLVPLEDGGYELVLSGSSGDYLGSLAGTLLVRTDVPGEETLRFRIAGAVRHPK